MAYPTLTENGITINPNYPIEEGRESTSIKSKMESGYVLTRARFTRQRLNFKLSYSLLSNTNKLSLEAHMVSVLDITPFNWTHPVSGVTYSVRYQSVPQFQYMQYQRWNVSFILEQV
jgi:hypothetical protein